MKDCNYPLYKISWNKARLFQFQEICELCADNALNNKYAAEAARLYIKSGNVEKALQCYASDLDYAEYIRLGAKFSNDETLRSTLKKMIVQMEARNNFVGVAEVLSFLDREVGSCLNTTTTLVLFLFKNNAKRILDCYCQALQWANAIRSAEEYVQQNSGIWKLHGAYLVKWKKSSSSTYYYATAH